MAKEKTPFFSMGARGTVGNVLTAQKLGSQTMFRKKPVPAYRYTLPQAYQRWLYQDYADLWTHQTEATKRQCANSGSRIHLTGFQYWMKYMLKNLPDIMGWWHMDINTLPTTPDSSPNSNVLTVVGASPADGIIDRGFSLDGINDELDRNYVPSLIADEMSIECFFYPSAPLAKSGIIGRFNFNSDGNENTLGYLATSEFQVNHRIGNLNRWLKGGTVTPSAWNFGAVNLFDGYQELFLNGLSVDTGVVAGVLPSGVTMMRVGRGWVDGISSRYKGSVDEIIIRNRILYPAEVLRHSERRYPVL